MIELSNDELLARLRSEEDHFTERKTFSDRDGWLKTAVAFANTAPVAWPAILFIGVTRKGSIELPTPNLDELQKKITSELDRAYPPIFHLPKIVEDEAGSRCLAVLVPGSGQRPHFSGKAYVRAGSQSREASEKQFDELIAQRQSKVYELLRWKGKEITVEFLRATTHGVHRSPVPEATLVDCTQFYLVVNTRGLDVAYALDVVRISIDPRSGNRLKLEISSTAEKPV